MHSYPFVIGIKALHGAVPAMMEKNHNGDYFASANFWWPFGWISQRHGLKERLKALQKSST